MSYLHICVYGYCITKGSNLSLIVLVTMSLGGVYVNIAMLVSIFDERQKGEEHEQTHSLKMILPWSCIGHIEELKGSNV